MQIMKPKILVQCLILGALLFSLVGCNFPVEYFFSTPISSEGDLHPVIPTVTPDTGPTETAVVVTDTPAPCAYAWSNSELPEETARLMDALKQAGLGGVLATVSAYGENCVDTANNTVISFAALESDFYFTLKVTDATDQVEMGNWADKILAVADQFPPGKVPGPSLGKAGFTFQDGKNSTNLSFSLEAAQKARKQGLRGMDLYKALGGK
jgi:hypothetical protein